MPAKQTPSHRKALRSAAAKKGAFGLPDKYPELQDAYIKGYELGRRHGRSEAQRTPIRISCIAEPSPTDSTPAKQNWLHRLWSKLVGR